MTPTEIPHEIERWFLQRGVPHLVENDGNPSIRDAWTRALPILVAAYLLLGLSALDLRNWSVAQNVAAAAVVIAMLLFWLQRRGPRQQ
jgi:Na+/H+ antiporter NhaD/arsenite permease-like protein